MVLYSSARPDSSGLGGRFLRIVLWASEPKHKACEGQRKNGRPTFADRPFGYGKFTSSVLIYSLVRSWSGWTLGLVFGARVVGGSQSGQFGLLRCAPP